MTNLLRRYSLRNALLLSVMVVGACASGSFAQENKVLATVNGAAITEADVKVALEDLQAQYPNLPADQQNGVALEFLIEVKLAAQAGLAAKLDQSDDFKRKMAYARERILMERVLTAEAAKATTDSAMKAYFDEQIGQVKPAEEARARHILVEDEGEAKKIHARVKAGEDFAKLAAEFSKDPGSGKEGGDLGFFTKDRMVPEFAEAAFKLKAGEISEPVKSQFGWHIIKLEELRLRPVPTFEQVKERLAGALVNKAQSELVAKLRKDAKIEMKEAAAAPKK